MAQVFPTKSNLMSTKKSLDLAKLGYDLLDRKRNILVHEMMQLIDKASKIQREIDETYSKAYLALQRANVTLGMCAEFAQAIPIDESLDIDLAASWALNCRLLRSARRSSICITGSTRPTLSLTKHI